MDSRALAVPAGDEDFEVFDSLRESRCPRGHFVGDGLRVVRKMLERKAVVRVLCTPQWLEKLPPLEGIEVRTASRERLDRLVGFRLHQGIMALGRIPPERPPEGTLFVALDDVSNAENVGALLRTCAAFGVDGVLVGPTTCSPWTRRAVRVSMAAPLQVPLHFVQDLAAAVRPLNAWAAHIHGERRAYTDVDYRGTCCLVLGGEANGPSETVLAACKGSIYIPMAEAWDCLNVGASAAVLLSEVRRQRAAT
jgi:tRNA G18 (ribose-2'-O)-methylase SpoU